MTTATTTDWFAPLPTPRAPLVGPRNSVLVRVEYQLPESVIPTGVSSWINLRLYDGYTNINSIPSMVKVNTGAKEFQIKSITFLHDED